MTATLRAVTSAVLLLAASRPSETLAIERTIRVAPEVELHVIDAGSAGGAPALVLIPGWRMTASIWKGQIEAFSKTRRVIAIDPRSQGDSTKVAEGITPEQRARDLDAVLKELHLTSVVLLGWSQGVQDVAAYVQAYGTASLKGVVLVDTAVSTGAAGITADAAAAADQLRMLSIYTRAPKAFSEGMMRAIIKRPLSEAELSRLVVDSLKTPTAIGAAMLVADLYGVDRTPALAKLDRPTLVIASAASDELEAQRAMVGRLPKGKLEVIADSAHAVFIDQPSRFNAILQVFLEGLT
jgi:non-heme chloroperoxidase